MKLLLLPRRVAPGAPIFSEAVETSAGPIFRKAVPFGEPNSICGKRPLGWRRSRRRGAEGGGCIRFLCHILPLSLTQRPSQRPY